MCAHTQVWSLINDRYKNWALCFCLILFFLMYVFCLHVCVSCMSGVGGGQKRALHSLKLSFRGGCDLPFGC